MKSGRRHAPGRPAELPYPRKLVPTPSMLRSRSAASVPVLGAVWKNPHRTPLSSWGRGPGLGDGDGPHGPTSDPTQGAGPGSKDHGLRSLARTMLKEYSTPNPEVPPSESMQTV